MRPWIYSLRASISRRSRKYDDTRCARGYKALGSLLMSVGFHNDRYYYIPAASEHSITCLHRWPPVDWVQDAARAQLQRRIDQRHKDGFYRRGGAKGGWRRKLWDSYDAGQAWIVITIIGALRSLHAEGVTRKLRQAR